MNSTFGTSEGLRRENGQMQLLEKNLQVHRKRKWVINCVCITSFLLAIICICFQVPKAVVITGVLLFTCIAFQIAHKALDKKIELRLKRAKQEQRKSMFKIK